MNRSTYELRPGSRNIILGIVVFLICGLLAFANFESMDTVTTEGIITGVVLLSVGVIFCCLCCCIGLRIQSRQYVERSGTDVQIMSHAVQIQAPDTFERPVKSDPIPISTEPLLKTTFERPQPGRMIDNTCQICLEHGWQVALRCGHLLCPPCFQKIAADKSVCPFCQNPIDVKDITQLFV